MSDQSDPVKTLLTARDRLVDERRALTVAIALGYRRRRSDDHQTNEMRETFVALQNTIDAIGRAIEDEQRLPTLVGSNAQNSIERHSTIADPTLAESLEFRRMVTNEIG